MPLHARHLGLLKTAFTGLFLSISAALNLAEAADMPNYPPPPAPFQKAMQPDRTCFNQHVLSRVSYSFYYQVRHVPGLPPVRIQSFSNIQPDHYDPTTSPYTIARHYCTATAHMNDGTSYPLAYVVADGQGFAGIGGMNVDFCVEGFDKWRVYNYDCRTVRWDYLNRNFRQHTVTPVYYPLQK